MALLHLTVNTSFKRNEQNIALDGKLNHPNKTRGKYFPSDAEKLGIIHEGWVDFNKNGVKDPYEDPLRPLDERVEDLLSRMTLEEKVAQLRSGFEIGEHGIGNLTLVLRNLPPREGARKANELMLQAIRDTRLGIPPIIHDECLHGCMARFSTSFPQAIALAATWDPELVYRVAKAIAKETRARGITQCLSPVVNIVRDVRAGRTEESYGEDPYLCAAMGEAFCRAMREEGVIATPKHYIANFVGDGGRDSWEIHFSERILREVYFPGFRACIKAGALSVMAAYNSLDGVPCSSNRWLLTDVLRGEWGFEGFVVSDYGSVEGILYKHRVARDEVETAKLALVAGLDVELPRTRIYGEPLLEAVRKGLISEEVLDEAVRRVLRVKFLIGLFDNPFVDPEEAEKTCGCEEHTQLALEAARKSMVLLKNDGVLPLDRERIRSIALLGPYADELPLGGYSGVPRRKVTPLEAIKAKVGPGVEVLHVKGCSGSIGEYIPIPGTCFETPSGEQGLLAEYFDNSELSGEPVLKRKEWWIRADWGLEPPDPKLPRGSFSVRWSGKLVAPESGTYELVLYAGGGGARLWLDDELLIDVWEGSCFPGRAVVELEAGRRYDIRVEYRCLGGYASMRLSWDYAGEKLEGVKRAAEAAAKADVAVVFVGIVEGEGRDRARLRLPKAQERLVEEVLATGVPTVVVLFAGSAVTGGWLEKASAVLLAWYPGQEGGTAIADVLFGDYNPGGKLPITWPRHVGQLPLYYNHKPSGRRNDYIDMPYEPLFPFGHSLSYTEFKYSGLRIESNGRGYVKVSFDVENVGDRAGEEVVQLYLRDLVASVARPIMELKSFKRISLRPGEKKTVIFELKPDDLAFFDSRMKRVVEPGEFEILVGSSSADIRLRGIFRVEERIEARFECEEPSIKREGDEVIIRLRVKNAGPIRGLATVKVLVGGVEPLKQSVELSAGEKRELRFKLPFSTVKDEKITLDVNGYSIELSI